MLPLGVPIPGAVTDSTVAVKVTASPVTRVLDELVTPTVAVAFSTFCMTVPVLWAKSVSPE